MYIKIPINLLQNNSFNSMGECMFYAFCASHTEDKEMSFYYSTENLQKVFPLSSAQLTRYLAHLVDLGIAKNKSYLFTYDHNEFAHKRNYKINTSLYWDSFNYKNGKAVDYLSVNLKWVEDYGFSYNTVAVLAYLWTVYFYNHESKKLYVKLSSIKDACGIKDRRTIYKALDQLVFTGFITEEHSDLKGYRLLSINDQKCLASDVEAEDTYFDIYEHVSEKVKGKSKSFVSSVKSYLKNAYRIVGDAFKEAYEELLFGITKEMRFARWLI